MGCSLLSGVEMIYYLTVGLFYRTKRVAQSARSMTVNSSSRKGARIEDPSNRKGWRVEGGGANKIQDSKGWMKEGSPDLNMVFGINTREWGYHKRAVVKQRF